MKTVRERKGEIKTEREEMLSNRENIKGQTTVWNLGKGI